MLDFSQASRPGNKPPCAAVPPSSSSFLTKGSTCLQPSTFAVASFNSVLSLSPSWKDFFYTIFSRKLWTWIPFTGFSALEKVIPTNLLEAIPSLSRLLLRGPKNDTQTSYRLSRLVEKVYKAYFQSFKRALYVIKYCDLLFYRRFLVESCSAASSGFSLCHTFRSSLVPKRSGLRISQIKS